MPAERVLVLGGASWNRMVYVDALPQGVSATITEAREAECVGSTGVGKAMALAALGYQPVLHCTLGRDDHGAKVIAACGDRNIKIIVDEQEAPTAHHLNIMDQDGGRFSLFLSDGGTCPTLDEARIDKAMSEAEVIFLSLAHSSRKLLPLLAHKQAKVLLDLHDYDGCNPWHEDFIACADVIQLSDVALKEPTAIIERLLAGRAGQVILTKGAAGAQVVSAVECGDVAVCPAEMQDSNGAGDAFSVGLWHAQASGMNLDSAGRFAAAMAAFAVESMDLFPAGITAYDIAARAAE